MPSTLTQDPISDVNIPTIIQNPTGLYEGNLIHYFREIFNNARNLFNPYHNFRHVFHVAWLCYAACEYYRDKLSPRAMRDLMIAALFHDFDHSGRVGQDDLEIERAIRGLTKHIAPEDRDRLEYIIVLIRATEFPHKIPAAELTLPAAILRDADVSQALCSVWIQQILFGLSSEMNTTPTKVLEMQGTFLGTLQFSTDWAKERFSREVIDSKIEEAHQLQAFLK